MKRVTGIAFTALAATIVATAPGIAAAVTVGATTTADLAADGGRPNGAAAGGSLSADGRYVAFSSEASNLVADDTNKRSDVFVRDTQAGITTRVSVSSAGAQASGFSGGARISADGRFVVFQSDAPNLVPGDTNGAYDLFVRDLRAGTTERISVTAAGAEGPPHRVSRSATISGDGRYVAFDSQVALVPEDTNNNWDVYVVDRLTGTREQVTVNSAGAAANAPTGYGDTHLSANGRFVVFASSASNLDPKDWNGTTDVFIRDLQQHTTRLVSAGQDGYPANFYSRSETISADGRFVAFSTIATNLGDGDDNFADYKVYVKDTQTGAVTRVDRDAHGAFVGASFSVISADGQFVAYAAPSARVEGKPGSDANVYLRDLRTGTVTPLTHDLSGQPTTRYIYPGALSADNRFVSLQSDEAGFVAGDTDGFTNVVVRALTP